MDMALYVDVSGHVSQHRVLTAAGYIANDVEWAAFEHAWAEVLSDAGASVFHATDFFACRRAFKHLVRGSVQHSQLAIRFASVAHHHLPLGMAWSLQLDTFDAIVASALRSARTPHDRAAPPMLATAALCNAIAQKTLPPNGPRARMFLEEGPGTGEVLAWLEALRTSGEPWTAAYTSFGSAPKANPAMQAADFLAHEAWHETQRVLDDLSRPWEAIERPTFKVLVGGPTQERPGSGRSKVEMRFATDEHYRGWAPAIVEFLRRNPSYRQRRTLREKVRRFRRALDLKWNRFGSTLRGVRRRAVYRVRKLLRLQLLRPDAILILFYIAVQASLLRTGGAQNSSGRRKNREIPLYSRA
jgi:hypothetical protein